MFEKTGIGIRQLLENFRVYKDRVAIIEDFKSVTYTELLYWMEVIGKNLQKQGLERVAICIENRSDVVLVALACLFAQVPFIIIDGKNPKIFNEMILTEAKISNVICEERLDINAVENISFEGLKQPSHGKVQYNNCSADKVLFFVATSGSTGKPKVAERYESAFCGDYSVFQSKFDCLFDQIAQQYAKLNFSYGLENTLLLLFGGTTICFGERNIGINDIEKMFDEIERNKATVVFWATPIIKLFSKHFRIAEKIPNCIKYIYTGGEPLIVSADFVVILKNKEITLINDYGCSELGKIFACSFNIELRDIDAFNMVGVGAPLKGYEAVVLNEDYKEDEEGFLYLKSKEKFKCGYVDKCILTNEIQVNGDWLYKTQDIARVENGEIVILGREINSVNVSGYRVELEQVECAINAISGVKHCVVLTYYNRYREANLYCFYDGEIDSKEVRIRLLERVPLYMIPISFTKTDEVYLLPNGKVDRKRNKEVFDRVVVGKHENVDKLKERIYRYLVAITGVGTAKLSDIFCVPFSEYGIDSLALVDFISTIEAREKVLIRGEVAGERIKCMKDIVSWINDSLCEKG